VTGWISPGRLSWIAWLAAQGKSLDALAVESHVAKRSALEALKNGRTKRPEIPLALWLQQRAGIAIEEWVTVWRE
jgi:hypothetical protein